MTTFSRIFLVGLIALVSAPAHSAGDPVAGNTAFGNQCAACDMRVVGTNGFGPSLAQVIGRRSASLSGWKFSTAMANAALTWNPATLDAFPESTTGKVPGSHAGLDRERDCACGRDRLSRDVGHGSRYRLLGGGGQPAPLPNGPTGDELVKAASDLKRGCTRTRTIPGQRYVHSAQISTANAARLRPRCIWRSTSVGATQASPLVYRGTMYFTLDEATVAIDAASCQERWHDAWVLKDSVLSKANRGVALKDGRLVRGTPDGYLIALSMTDGSLLKSRKIADSKNGQYLSMPPLIFEDRVIYGPAGADWGAKNWIGAFRARDGRAAVALQSYSRSGRAWIRDLEQSAGPDARGGSLWTPLALDAGKGILDVPGQPVTRLLRSGASGG